MKKIKLSYYCICKVFYHRAFSSFLISIRLVHSKKFTLRSMLQNNTQTFTLICPKTYIKENIINYTFISIKPNFAMIKLSGTKNFCLIQ